MKITFDTEKRLNALNERGLDFLDANIVFNNAVYNEEDTRHDYGEKRMTCYGTINGRLCMVGYTDRGDERQVFTMRKANDREQKRFANQLGKT